MAREYPIAMMARAYVKRALPRPPIPKAFRSPPPSAVPSVECVAIRRRGTQAPERCRRPATSVVFATCAHRHVRRALLCAVHLDAYQLAVTHCATCHTGREPHDCLLRVVAVTAIPA